jgi:hypothetical protein
MTVKDGISCPHCQTDLRRCGILEHGVVTFQINLVWDELAGSFSIGHVNGVEAHFRRTHDDFAAGEW